MPSSASSTGHGQAQSECRRVDLRLRQGVGDRLALGRLLYRSRVASVSRQSMPSILSWWRPGRVTDPVAEPPEIVEDDLDVGARLMHEGQLSALVVPGRYEHTRSCPADQVSSARKPRARARREQALVRDAGAAEDVVAGRAGEPTAG